MALSCSIAEAHAWTGTPRPVPALAGTRALTTVLAGASPEAGVVAGPVRLLLIRPCGLAGWVSASRGSALSGRGEGRLVAGWAAPAGWGYRGGAGPGPAPPPS